MLDARFKIPENLGPQTERWFVEVCSGYELQEHHLRLLSLACRCWDRIEEARKAIETHGATYIDRFHQPKCRPEIAIERDAITQFARLIRELDIDNEPASDRNRPPALQSNRR
jgi:phage terminase small subunit